MPACSARELISSCRTPARPSRIYANSAQNFAGGLCNLGTLDLHSSLLSGKSRGKGGLLISHLPPSSLSVRLWAWCGSSLPPACCACAALFVCGGVFLFSGYPGLCGAPRGSQAQVHATYRKKSCKKQGFESLRYVHRDRKVRLVPFRASTYGSEPSFSL